MARGCRDEQDDAIDDPGDVEEEDRHNCREKSKSQDHLLVSLIGQGASKMTKWHRTRSGRRL